MILALQLSSSAPHGDSRICLVRFTKFDLDAMRRRMGVIRKSLAHDGLFIRARYLFYGDIVITNEDCEALDEDALNNIYESGQSIVNDVPDDVWNNMGHDDFTLGGCTVNLDEDDMYLEVWEKHSGEEFFSSPFTLETVKECLK